MIGDIIVISCLIAPFALMWWLLRVQRGVRAQPRRAPAEPSDVKTLQGIR